MTGYGDAEKAFSLMALKHLISSTGVVKVLHSNAQLNQNWRMEKKKKEQTIPLQAIEAWDYRVWIFGLSCIPSMKNQHIIFCRIWPQIELYHSYASLQCLCYWNITAVATELVSNQIRIMAGINEIMR